MDAVAVYDILSRRNPTHEHLRQNVRRVVIKKGISCAVLCARNTVFGYPLFSRGLVNMTLIVRD